jgi:S-adenosylmethionine synthetase
LSFTVPTGFGERGFELPVRVAGVLRAMQQDHAIPRSKCTQVQASRVAWRVARDWLRAQLALIDAGLAGLDEVMMPYMLADGGHTTWELYAGSQEQIEGGAQ